MSWRHYRHVAGGLILSNEMRAERREHGGGFHGRFAASVDGKTGCVCEWSVPRPATYRAIGTFRSSAASALRQHLQLCAQSVDGPLR